MSASSSAHRGSGLLLGPGGRSTDIISVLGSRRGIPPPGAASTQPGVRLAFPPSSTAAGVVNGSWWPRTRDPTTELPALVAAVADRLGGVRRIALNTDAWNYWPHQLVIIGGPRVRLDWGAADAHTIRLTGGGTSHLNLLAIPPDTPTVLALVCLARAARDVPSAKRAGVPVGLHPGQSSSSPSAMSVHQRGQQQEDRRRDSDLTLLGRDAPPPHPGLRGGSRGDGFSSRAPASPLSPSAFAPVSYPTHGERQPTTAAASMHHRIPAVRPKEPPSD
jgi:hypothetical protein